MNYTELIVTIGLFFLVTIDDDNQWHKKHGHLGLHKDTLNTNKKLAYDRSTSGYLLAMGLLVLYIIKLFLYG